MNRPNLLIFFLTLLLFVGCGQQQDVRVIKLGHGLGVSHPVHEALIYLSQLTEEKSEGKLQIKVYPNQQLGTERELMELLQIGSLGMTKVSSAVMEGFAPKLQVFSLPYLFKDDEHQDRILNGPIGKKLLLESEDYWLRGLTYYDAGKRSFYTKDAPIEHPDNLKGLKIRVMESNMASNMVKAFGGSPTPVSYGELYTALQQGIVDGAENNPPSLYTSRHYEVCKYYAINEHVALPDILVISTKVWNTLSYQEKVWLQEAADESAVYQQKIWQEAEIFALEEMEKAGVKITYPDQGDFRSAVELMFESLKENKPEIYTLYQEIQQSM
ncbi:TRAP transporter substrate-binding protein [Litoribacter alkaliphilus]|uniref:TRAP transporter substrate-binding protein n=1 Tax=Litoribacter ruber TaxID=702568 RepID=A0AAP2G393_9BACT|nr:TRAP transporter substrate-binding protein [Litoribacter alkaliphilus]MBS9522786.1 TRAP transporter substrate-binding protein [Litoribacter alkaliphilus]